MVEVAGSKDREGPFIRQFESEDVPSHHRAFYRTIVAVIVHTLWTSAAPAMSYPLYARQFFLSASTIAAIFAIYPVAVVLALLLLGDLSGQVGKKNAMLLGVSSSIMGVALFALANGPIFLFLGRAFMGVGVGVSASPAAAALVDFAPPGRRHLASATNTAAQAFGLAASTLVGGTLIQFAPLPLRLNYVVLLGFLIVVFFRVSRLPPDMLKVNRTAWRPRALGIPRSVRSVFIASAPACVSAFMLGSVVLSAGAQIAHDLVNSSNVLINGLLISLFAGIWAVVSLAFRRVPFRLTVLLGGTCGIASMIILIESGTTHSLPLFLLSTAIGGAGYGLLFLSGIGNLYDGSNDSNRAPVLSSLYLFCYLVQALTAVVLGMLISSVGLGAAVRDMSIVISIVCALSIGAIWWSHLTRRSRPGIAAR